MNFPDNKVEFAYVFCEHHGNRFAGESSNSKLTETIIGALQPGQ